MAITNVSQYVKAVADQVTLNMRFGYWQVYEHLLAYRDADDPESFDRFGRPASDPEHGDLGFYPVPGIMGSLEPLYLPNWQRFILICGGEIDPNPGNPVESGMKMRGKPMVAEIPEWDGRKYTALVLPVMNPGSRASFTFQQSAQTFIPFAGNTLVKIEAVRRANALEVIFSWANP